MNFRSYKGEGWQWDDTYLNMLHKLGADLQADGIKVNKDGFSVTGYDGSHVAVKDRYHELWVSGAMA